MVECPEKSPAHAEGSQSSWQVQATLVLLVQSRLHLLRSSLHRRADLSLHEQLDKAPADTRVNDGLDLVIGAV